MGNIALFLFCLLTGGYVLWETGTYPPPADMSLDAGLYPRVLVAVLFLLTAILAYTIIRERKGASVLSGSLPCRASLVLIGCMVGYCLLLTVVGYALATIVFVFVVTLLFRGSMRDGVLVSLSATVFLEALFRGGFQVPLPPGMLNLF